MRPPSGRHHRGAGDRAPVAGVPAARLATVPGAIAIVVVLLLLPVAICMGGAAIAAALGIALNRDAEVRAEGSELLDLNV